MFVSTAGALRQTITMQHKSHQPLQPCASKYLQFRWDKNGYDIHKKKVRCSGVNGIYILFSGKCDIYLLFSLEIQKLKSCCFFLRKEKIASTDYTCHDFFLLFKVQSAKATVNTTPPKIYNHILLKRKKKMVINNEFTVLTNFL